MLCKQGGAMNISGKHLERSQNRTAHIRVAGLSLLFAPVFALVFFSYAGATAQTTVRPGDIQPIADILAGPPGWYKEIVGTANAEPTSTTPYNVAGSAEFTVTGPSSSAELGLYKYLPSIALASLPSASGLSYATRQVADNTKAVSLQINMDADVSDSNTSWQGRLVFEPYLNRDVSGNPVIDGVWQTWPTLRTTAQWWMTWSASLTANYGTNPCPQANPCTVPEIFSLFHNIGFNSGTGNALILKAGSGWTNFTGFADVPAIHDEYWDFEPATATRPLTKDDCKHGGWMNYGSTFKNQGLCVSAVTKQ